MTKRKLDTIKTSGFKTPKDYFSEVEEQILNDIHLKNKVEASGFDVPESYFESLDDRIFAQLDTTNDTKVRSLFSWKKTVYATAIAASIVLMFNLFFTSETITISDIDTASIEDYLEIEDYTSLDLASLLTDEELHKDNFIENEIPENSIEDYLINTIEIEDLIIE
ncbi:hypothetical protein [Psychroserpens sp. SPM9]|uniref:hypothetical protein n=1 Tax=Psychroserpens sp. SPM9 TaxID=2975598 RepID=UPI0021A63E27|nr:hypothetical protein [Psychroserpens sp. SPM9]MDG5492142.1 hypothetical protein [Psychroserpens sp. SPM9]